MEAKADTLQDRLSSHRTALSPASEGAITQLPSLAKPTSREDLGAGRDCLFFIVFTFWTFRRGLRCYETPTFPHWTKESAP